MSLALRKSLAVISLAAESMLLLWTVMVPHEATPPQPGDEPARAVLFVFMISAVVLAVATLASKERPIAAPQPVATSPWDPATVRRTR